MSEDPPLGRQAGVAIGEFASDSNPHVAQGDRRETVHYEPDLDQLTRVSDLVKPMVLRPDEMTRDPPAGGAPVVQDAAMVPPGPSAWEAAPDEADDDHGR
jgi:hypothetical protein